MHPTEAEHRRSPVVDLREWGRFRQAAASLRLENGIREGVMPLLESAGDALRVIGNSGDLCDLQVAEARFWLLEGKVAKARRLLTSALEEECFVTAGHSQGFAELLLAGIELADDREAAATAALMRAALAFEKVGAYPRSVDAWRRHAVVLGARLEPVGAALDPRRHPSA